MKTKLVKIIEDSGLQITKAQFLLKNFQGYFQLANEWETKAKAIVVTDKSQVTEMKMAREARLFLQKKRTGVEKARVALKAEALREGQTIDAIARILKNLLIPIEEHLGKQEKFIEIEQAKLDEVARIEAEEKAERERIKAEAVIEAERIRKEKEDRAERKRIKAENTKLKIENEKAQKAQHLAEEKTRKEQEKAVEAKRKANEKIRKEKERREAAEAEQRRMIEEKKQVEEEKKAEIQRAKTEKAKLEKEKKYQNFLKENGYNNDTADDFCVNISNDQTHAVLYKKIAEINL